MNASAVSIETINNQIAVLRVGSHLSFENAIHFTRLTTALLGEGVRFFIVDFSKTGILDSTGLGAAFALFREVTARAGRLLFAAPSENVRVVLQLTRTYRAFPPYSTVEAALEAIALQGARVLSFDC